MMKWQVRVLSVLSMSVMLLPSLASADEMNYHRHEHKISGCIESAAPYTLDLSGGRHVRLHNGTIIHPTGVTLRSHMRVSILGHRDTDGDAFIADRIKIEHRECHRRDYDGGSDRGWQGQGFH